ncbi:MAG: GrpB family protein [Planctomycetales bacterium]|nr:GrpB family protein [Planctomycetales bacterium]
MMVTSRYTFSEYSSDWTSLYAQEAAVIRKLLGDELLAVYHIGSTSVPGLAAKPIIDMLPVTRNIDAIDLFAARLADVGYRAWGEFGLVGRRFFTKDFNGYRTHNVHISEAGHPDIERHVAFRTYLRAHPTAWHEYESLKREVYRLHPNDINAYNNGKDNWIKKMEQRAIKWYRDHGGDEDTVRKRPL